MMQRRRKAEFDANLIVIDEPQVICLNAKKTKIIAVAVPFSAEGNFNFIAASVTAKNWDRYLDSNVDLRFLFTYPFQRSLYTFNVGNFKGHSIFLEPFDGDFIYRRLRYLQPITPKSMAQVKQPLIPNSYLSTANGKCLNLENSIKSTPIYILSVPL